MKSIKILLASLFISGMFMTSCDEEGVLPPIVGSPTMLENNMDGFTIEAVNAPEGVNIWTWSNQYGAVASAYTGGTRYTTDVYLVSPEITLSTEPVCTFSQAINYLYSYKRENFINLCIRVDGGDWETLEVDKWPAGSSWTFNDSNADLSAYANQTVQLGFHYQSTSQAQPTWEVKSLRVY